MDSGFQFIPISQMVEKFPENSWWSKHNTDSNEEQFVAYFEGDLTLSHLDLDWDKPFPEQEEVMIIFVNGNFAVGNLYNYETDGAVSLMVMGHLTATNIAVGGQEIFVQNDLLVEHILCGSYNHGEMIIEGNLQAFVIIQDEEYRFQVEGERRVYCTVNVWDPLAVCEEFPIDIRKVLVEDVFLEEEEDAEDEVNFSFGMLVSVLKAGRSAFLNWNDTLARKQVTTNYFTQHTIDEENIRKLTESVLMIEENSSFEFEERDVYFKVEREHLDVDGDKQNANVYIETKQYHYFIYLNEDQSISLLMKDGEAAGEWEEIGEEDSAQLTELLQCWTLLLTCVNVAELYMPNIKVKDLQAILQHPVVQQLDSYGEENDGYWDGSKYYGFRREAYTDEDGYCFAARIHIETMDSAFYYYTLDNSAYVSRHYQPPDQAVRQNISLLDVKRLEASERYYDRFQQFITQKLGVVHPAEE